MQSISGEWRRGWRSVLAGTMGMTFMTAAFNVTGVVMVPIMAEFGWSRSVVTANILIISAVTFLMAPLAGRIIRRFGVRRYASASILIAAPLLLLVSQVNGVAENWYLLWLVYGLINLGVGPLVWSAAVTTLFDRSRGLALALTLSGAGIAYMVVPWLAFLVMTEFGWRAVYVVLAASFLLVQFPLTLFVLKTGDDFRERLADPAAERAAAAAATAALPGLTLAEAMRGRQFWQLVVLSVAVAIVEGAMAIHLFPILTEGGLGKEEAASVAGIMGLAMIVGRLAAGVLLDRFDGVKVFASSIVFILIACLLVRVFDGGRLEGIAISILLGLGAGGTTNVLAYLAGQYFGLKDYASIFGIFLGSFAFAYGAAPLIASYLRDVLASYAPMFTGSAIAMVVATVVALLLGKAPIFERRTVLPV